MPSTTTAPSSLTRLVCQMSINLHHGHDIQRTLTNLNHLVIPITILRGFEIQRLATRYIIDQDAKVEARALVAKIRRMERESATAPKTTITSGSCQNTIKIGTEEIMVSSKRTAPVMTAPRPKKVSAQLAPLRTITEKIERTPDQLSKLDAIKMKLAAKKETVKAQKRSNVLIEIQQSAMPEPPQKKRFYRRF